MKRFKTALHFFHHRRKHESLFLCIFMSTRSLTSTCLSWTLCRNAFRHRKHTHMRARPTSQMSSNCATSSDSLMNHSFTSTSLMPSPMSDSLKETICLPLSGALRWRAHPLVCLLARESAARSKGVRSRNNIFRLWLT